MNFINNKIFMIKTSEVNFCEDDLFFYGIGEFYNTISSFIISIFGIYGLYKLSLLDNNKYYKYKYIARILYIMLILIGLSSVYFHSRLSIYSHWIDIILISLILVFSQYSLKNNFKEIKIKIKYFIFFIFHLILSIKIPSIHIFILFITGFHIQNEIKNKFIQLEFKNNCNNKILINKYNNVKIIFMFCILFWIIDYLGCNFIKPYHTHWIFHILIGLTSYKIINLFKIFY